MTKPKAKYAYETTIPYLDFNFRKFSKKATLEGIVFAQSLEEIDRFLFFERVIYHYFEPTKESVISGFLEQVDNESEDWNKHFQEIFDWKEQEKIVSELIFTRIVNWYTVYLVEMAHHVIKKTNPALIADAKKNLRTFPRLKKYYRNKLDTPLCITAQDEILTDQIITLRNLIVHNLHHVPDKYMPKFHNWQKLGCIKRNSDVLYIELDFSSLERLGNFLSKSIADIDKRISQNFDLDTYYFDEGAAHKADETRAEKKNNIDEGLF